MAMARTEERLERYETAVRSAESFYFQNAERLNGRMAMIGFLIAVGTEALTGHTLIGQVVFGIFGIDY